MGRGRQKAKHTKIARQLKSFSPDVNYDALERELTGHSHHEDHQYDDWADKYEPEGYDPEDDYEDTETETPKRA
ncbi:DUF3073 domain-containing protein [Leifsonia sp. F6_8S_P_1B]|uniref:DUF3073 domain-containing protein n=1 Tax=Leifsonia williamsii TaxID=3035919 RepID=A0ABT8K6C7_9MICO|nr:DUF3073 domain-containing protein [Leifsonia williamsii]MDN4612995.1 DUF3073 domain-containing protein [Leifsonia williamsii]